MLSHKWRTLLILALAELMAMGLWFSASAVAPLLAQQWQLDDNGKALLTLSVQLGFVVGAFLSALLNLSDRLPAFLLFSLSAFAGALANALIPLSAHDLILTVPLRFLTGVCLAGVYPVGLKIMATWCREDLGLGLGLLVGALSLGSATPQLLNALGGLSDWRLVLLIASALAILGGLLALFFVKEGPLHSATPPFNGKFVLRVWQERSLRLANFGYLGHMWELYAMWTWIPFFLTASYTAMHVGDAARWASTIAFVAIGIGGLGSLLAGVWADHIGRTRVSMVSLLVSGSCALLAGAAFDSSPWVISSLTLLWGIAIIADSAQYSASISELSPHEYTGTALTLQTGMGFLLTLVSIRLVPALATLAGWQWAFAILSIGPAFGIWAMFALQRLPEAARLANGRG